MPRTRSGRPPILLFVAEKMKSFSRENSIVLLNKADKGHVMTEDDIREIVPESSVISLSAKTGEGLELLKEEILAIATGNGSYVVWGVVVDILSEVVCDCMSVLSRM